MNPRQTHKSQIITAVFLLLLLACGPLNRLQELNQKGRVLATGVAVIGEGNFLAFEAYEKLYRLPGYRLESRSSIRDEAGRLSSTITSSDHDTQGNVHTLITGPDGQQYESYIIADQTYVFSTHYNGWINASTVITAETQQTDNAPLAGLDQIENFMQLLPQFGAVPTKSGQEMMHNRPVTRYELDYITADLARAFSDQINTTVDLYGTLWIDDQTGALLRSEFLLYEETNRQPRREFVLEVSQIGAIGPIKPPSPIVNPVTIISATATAQAWSTLQATLNYQGQPASFEMIPIQINSITDQAEPEAELQLNLRQLPAHLPLETESEAFLTRLGQQLSLSIPQHNSLIKSNNFRVESIDFQNRTIVVTFLFQANLENFSHVELVLAGAGNPLFAPVPVAHSQ